MGNAGHEGITAHVLQEGTLVAGDVLTRLPDRLLGGRDRWWDRTTNRPAVHEPCRGNAYRPVTLGPIAELPVGPA